MTDFVEHMRHNKELDKRIIRRIAAGETLQKICEDKHMPALYTLQRWINERLKFRRMFIQAVAHGIQANTEASILLADEIMKAVHRGADRSELAAIKAYVTAKSKALDNYCRNMQKVLGYFAKEEYMFDEEGNRIEHTEKQKKEKTLLDFLEDK